MPHRSWNRLARQFEHAVCDVTTSSGSQLAELVRHTHPGRGKTLIDAGCGIGSFVARFGRRFGDVVAFDFASQMVSRARKRCAGVPNVQWMTMGLEEAAANLGPIGDLVACLNVITSTDADLRRRQWESLAGLPRRGGFVLLVVPALESARRVMQFADDDNKIHHSDFAAGLVYRGDAPQKHYTRDELRDVLRANQLRVLTLKRIHYPWSDDGIDELDRQRPWSWVALVRKSRQRT